MSVAFKRFLYLLALLTICLSNAHAQESARPIFKICTPTGDCSAVIPVNKSGGLCEAQPARVAWHKDGEQYAIQCDCNCTEQSNKNWIVDEARNTIYRIDFGRFVNKQVFASSTSPAIPDKFSSHGMCHSANKDLVDKSSFIFLSKSPSSGGGDPYCYEPYYVIMELGKLKIEDNAHELSSKDSNYWSIENSSVVLGQLKGILDQIKK